MINKLADHLFTWITPKEIIGVTLILAGLFALQWIAAHVIVKIAGF